MASGHSISSLLNEFQPYFFTRQLVTNITKKEETVQVNTKIEKIIYRPSKLDTLFWCYYILKNDILAYEINENNMSFVIEKKHKIELVEYIRENKSKLKGYKLVSIDHIENQLANELKIDMPTFFSLCYMDKLQVVYFNDKCYSTTLPFNNLLNEKKVELYTFPLKDCEDSDYEDERELLDYSIYEQHKQSVINVVENITEEKKEQNNFDNFFMLKKDQKTKTYYLQQYNYNDINWISYYKIENVSKPLKSVSAYTLTQLKDIAMVFNLDISKKKKQVIYDELKELITIDVCSS
jgi:hypothetical protein